MGKKIPELVDFRKPQLSDRDDTVTVNMMFSVVVQLEACKRHEDHGLTQKGNARSRAIAFVALQVRSICVLFGKEPWRIPFNSETN